MEGVISMLMLRIEDDDHVIYWYDLQTAETVI